MLSLSTRFKPSVPAPLPVFAVTVQVVPLPVTEVIEVPDRPATTSEKSPLSTPVTLSLKVTVHDAVAPLVGLALARTIDVAVGGVVSPGV